MHVDATTAKIETPAIPGMVAVAQVPRTRGPLAIIATICAAVALALGLTAGVLHGTGDPLAVRDGSLVVAVVGSLLALGLLHEASHALAARILVGLPWRRITFRPAPALLGLDCHITGRVAARDHRRIGLAPAVCTALPLAALALLFGGQLVVIAMVVALAYLPRDLADLWRLRHAAADDILLLGGDGRTHVFRRRDDQLSVNNRT
jgi:hypothetical protein